MYFEDTVTPTPPSYLTANGPNPPSGVVSFSGALSGSEYFIGWAPGLLVQAHHGAPCSPARLFAIFAS